MKGPNFAEVAGRVRRATPALATLVSAVAATATLYLYVRDRRPRLRVNAKNTRFYRNDGTLVARSSDFARRHFYMFNEGNKPVKVEEVRVEFDGKTSEGFPITGMRLDVDTERQGGPIPGWLDQNYQITSCSVDLREVERSLARQGHSGPTKVRLVVRDALDNTYGSYFEVLARHEEGPMSKMHKVLRGKLRDRVADSHPRKGVRVDRGEIEAMGNEIGLRPDEAVKVFEELGRAVWRGEYESGDDEEEWFGVRVTFIGSV